MRARQDMGGREQNCKIRIRNCAGVPVVEIVGELNKAALRAIETTISTLASAGHYHIVLNVKKAVAANIQILGRLRRAAESVIRHYGAIDVVAEASQIGQLLPLRSVARLFRFCTSENEALRRIKRLSRPPDADEPACSAHITEAK
jgi:hypothetical protein